MAPARLAGILSASATICMTGSASAGFFAGGDGPSGTIDQMMVGDGYFNFSTGGGFDFVDIVSVSNPPLGTVVDAVRSAGGCGLITADHGNAECMLQPDGTSPHTAHTTNPVPCLLFGTDRPREAALAPGAALRSIAPTLCDLLGIDPPPEMTGESLL